MNMNIKKVDLNDLISPEYNPRQISKEELSKLKKSINEFGYIAPIVVNKYNNNIIAGNQRAKALKELGYSKVDVIFVNIEDLEKEKMASISLNKIAGEFDEKKLTKIFKELKIGGFDLELTGFTDLELEDFIDDELEFDLVTEEEEKSPVKEVVFVPTDNEELIEETKPTIEDKPVEEKTVEIKETKYSEPKNIEEPKNKLIKKEINITEEYSQSDEDYEEETGYYDDYVEDFDTEDSEKNITNEEEPPATKKSYDPFPDIPVPDYFPLAPIKKLIKDAGAERVSDGACKYLGNILEENAKQISEKAVMMANVAGRKTVSHEDFEIIIKS